MNNILQKININKLLISIMLLMVSVSSYADEAQEEHFSDAELAQMLAPIALYPDSLLTHILIASTYPLEVVAAERWLSKRDKLSKEEIDKQSEDVEWDASVKALLAFPTVISKLSEDLTWMQNLGDAFLQDEENVLATIQVLRQQADKAGSLAKMDNVQIVKEKTTIIIEQAEPEVIYVPYYDTRTVYGRWGWSHYPPIYWNTPNYYGYNRGPFYWNSGIHIGLGFSFSQFHWHDRYVVVDYSRPRNYHSRKRISTSNTAKRWYHQPTHRKGVAYRSNHLKQKFSSSRPVTGSTRKVTTSNRVTTVSSPINERKKIDNRDVKREHKNIYAPVSKSIPVEQQRHKTFKQKLQERPPVKQVKVQPRVINEPTVRYKEQKRVSDAHTVTTVTKTKVTNKPNVHSIDNQARSSAKYEVKERKTYSQPRPHVQRQRVSQNNHKTSQSRVKGREKSRE